MDRVRRDIPDFLHGAVGIEAEEFQVVADMFVTGKAGRAGAAMVKRPDDDTLADRDVLNSGTDRRDGARHFMPDDSFKADAGVHIAVEDVHVGAADPAIGDPDGHLAIRRGGRCPRSTVNCRSPR